MSWLRHGESGANPLFSNKRKNQQSAFFFSVPSKVPDLPIIYDFPLKKLKTKKNDDDDGEDPPRWIDPLRADDKLVVNLAIDTAQPKWAKRDRFGRGIARNVNWIWALKYCFSTCSSYREPLPTLGFDKLVTFYVASWCFTAIDLVVEREINFTLFEDKCSCEIYLFHSKVRFFITKIV